eukprot:13411988-Alexandrium_andersonii.AAC.1
MCIRDRVNTLCGAGTVNSMRASKPSMGQAKTAPELGQPCMIPHLTHSSCSEESPKRIRARQSW